MNSFEEFFRFYKKKGSYHVQQYVKSHPEYYRYFRLATAVECFLSVVFAEQEEKTDESIPLLSA